LSTGYFPVSDLLQPANYFAENSKTVNGLLKLFLFFFLPLYKERTWKTLCPAKNIRKSFFDYFIMFLQAILYQWVTVKKGI